ncbi:ATP-dependent RNA helicase TDRD9 isoform X1 [Corvus hawaiiensis]|uniref:ATP-dependent RNA helicase TDRD9 isoform X1 n=2 Tax=Corvus hawaiiensis TaxID=134902 RepID=UPI002019C625|nr:ATP-dependent RNA helicase TDRD9 isoform X1 [Corvus hawaiiensis]
MLRKLTEKQSRDWFTIGGAVSAVELLDQEARLGRPGASPRHPAREPLTAAGLPISESVGTEYTKKYRQAEEQELNVAGNDQYVYKPGTSLSQCESSDSTSIPISKCKYLDMPTAKHREKIVSLIQNNSVVIVEGATGSGKSTQIPQYILDYCTSQSMPCNIAVTQPRKISASSLARWISKERSWTLGGFVGYQLSLENVSTKETRLLYMTTGVLLQRIVSARSLTQFTHIFIDEVHERTEEIDFLLLVTRKLLCTNSQSVKIILMSASINSKELADYFALPVHNGLNPVCVFKVEGRPFAVEEYYLDDLKENFDFQLHPQSLGEPVIEQKMYQVAVSLIQSFDELEKRSNREKKSLSGTLEHGSVLVFLPGLGEIRYMHSCLSQKYKRWQVYPFHACATLEEQSKVFSATVPGYRKVILATNIAESSVTVPDVKYVIDFCLTKILFCDKETNYQSLRLCWASKTNCNQRKGRAGRVSKGYCYRLVHKAFWADCIPEKSEPELLHCPLGATVLKLKKLDIGEPKALLATALSPPSVGDIERTIVQLKELGAITACVQTEENLHDGELTFLGTVLTQLPVDLHLGKLIILGHVFGCLEECLIIAAALSLRNFFTVPFKKHVDAYRKKMVFAGNSRSDCIAIVNAFRAWQACKQQGKLRHPMEELEWGRSNFVHINKIKEVAELFHNLKRRVSAFNMHVKAQPSAMDQEYVHKQRFILQVVIAGAFYPNYCTFGKCQEEIAMKDLAGKDPKTTVMLKNMPPYGYIYHKQLQSLLRQCGQVKSISYSGSRAFVEFSRNPKEVFKVLPEVYLAIKMSQLKIPFELCVHYPDDIRRQVQGAAAAGLEFLRVNVDCQKQTVEPVEISFGDLQMSKKVPSRFLSIRVTEVVEVGHFWGYRTDEKNTAVLKALNAEINYQNLMDLAVPPRVDVLCLAPFTYLGKRGYYRAHVLYVHGDLAEVFFVDYGNRSEVPLNKLKEIPSCLQELPFQALEFKMCKMCPSAQSLVCGEPWSCSASQRFASLVSGCTLLVEVYSLVHGVLHVDVFRHSGRRGLVNIRDVLIEEYYAELAEESYESRQSHDLLKELFLDKAKEEKQMPVSSRHEEKHLIERLLSCFSENKSDAPTHKVTVFGPFSPYQLKCYSLTKVSQFRDVLIHRESINSIVVHDDAEDRFQQLLVATDVSVNAAGSVILGETSLMPPIHGLLALLSMLFAPAIELRVDKSGKYFTGVLCGLGWSQTSGVPLLPANDMELTFDVHFGLEDITEINSLRTAMNKLLCEHAVCYGQEQVAQLQENIRQKLLCLICKSKPRDIIDPTWYEKPYAWNQVDSQRIIDESEKQPERGNFVYQLHKLVLLND